MAGFSRLFRRRLWFSLDVARHKLVGYRAAPLPATTTAKDADAAGKSPPSSRDGSPTAISRPTVSIDLRSAGIYANPTEKFQFTVA